jgi:hypothetical protein
MRDRTRWRERALWTPATPQSRGRRDDEVKGLVHTFVCPACHAILKTEAWFVDEMLYRQLDGQVGVWPALCPGCLRVARGMYEGEVILSSQLLVPSKSAALDLIANEEERARRNDPASRLTAVDDRGNEIQILTTTPALAERIGKAFRRAYEGDLEIENLPADKLRRVCWHRE